MVTRCHGYKGVGAWAYVFAAISDQFADWLKVTQGDGRMNIGRIQGVIIEKVLEGF